MFQPCPNCGFLVARSAPRRGGTEQRCPRCGQALPLDDNASVGGHGPTEVPTLRRRDAETVTTRPPGDAVAAPGARARDDRDAVRGATASASDRASSARPTRDEVAPAHSAARHDDARRSTASDAAAPPVIVHAQPEPPPAAQVHTAPAMARPAPSFVRAPSRMRTPKRPWPLHAGIAVLALVLALQLVLAQRETLAAQARWRPVVEGLCGVFGCSVPAWREPSAFAMLDRSVLPKPGTSGVLTARASFRNEARWPQPWPTLVLTLSDVDGVPLGRRAFAPEEYAGDGARTLMPGQSASVQLDVVEPAPGVVAFAFDFR